jgi:hypothetical protein
VYKNIVLLILFSSFGFASEPKFHYGDCVKIAKGFFKGCKGHTTLYTSGKYDVDGDCKFGSFHETFEENELERCKK